MDLVRHLSNTTFLTKQTLNVIFETGYIFYLCLFNLEKLVLGFVELIIIKNYLAMC